MKKLLKLGVLFILCISVYYIYKDTKDSSIIILNIGDGLAAGINSYGIKSYSYADYYKEYMEKKGKVELINKYANKEQSFQLIKEKLNNTGELKKDLISSHIVFLCLGYNDLKYKMSLEDNINNTKLNIIIESIAKDYNETINEIRKYYKNKIIVIGYYCSNKEDYYFNNGIKKLNRVLRMNKEIEFIDTYNEIKGEKYLSNPSSYFPNDSAYQLITNKIITKTLEK